MTDQTSFSFAGPPTRADITGKSNKQRAVISHLQRSESMTLTEAVALIGRDIYCNRHKHVGAILSNMVKRGLIERVKPGVFRMPVKRVT